MSAAPVVIIPIRRAHARDVKNAQLSRWAAIVYKDLVTHANAENMCWPKRETQAKDLHVSARTITNARNELLDKGWICYPEGDAGGRDFSKESWLGPRGRGLRIHLHPDGCPCGRPTIELKQKAAASAANEKRARKRSAQEVIKDEIRSSLNRSVKDEKPEVKDENGDSTYKEGTLPTGTISTTTSARAHEPRQIAVAAEALKEEKPESKTSFTWAELLKEAEIVQGLEQLQALLKDRLDWSGKIRILQAAKEHSFSLRLLHWAFERHGGGRNRAGGLIQFAINWELSTAGVLPSCAVCLDDGVIEHPGSPYQGLAPCSCKAGQEKAKSVFPHFEAWQADRSFCVACEGSGDGPFSDPCSCAAGRRRAEQLTSEQAQRKPPARSY